MKVEIWSDIACPWCHIGKRRFERALAAFSHRDEVEVVFRSFELDPRAPRRQDRPAVELLARKYGVTEAQAAAMNARMEGEAAREGLHFDLGLLQSGNTFDAHRLIHLAAAHGRQDAMVDRLFRAYLGEGEALGIPDVLVRLGEEAGLDGDAVRAMLAGDDYADAVRADEERARRFGIDAVPFFAIDEKYGVPGAQPPEVLLGALQQAWNDAQGDPDEGAAAAVAGVDAGADACADGSCAV